MAVEGIKQFLFFDYYKKHPEGIVCDNCELSFPWTSEDIIKNKFILIDYINKNEDGTTTEWRKMFCQKCNDERKK